MANSPEAQEKKLQQEIDFDNEFERDLIAIAQPLTDWEVKLTAALGLRPDEVDDLGQIRNPVLRRQVTLHAVASSSWPG